MTDDVMSDLEISPVPVLENELLAAEYAEKLGLANMAKDIQLHISELFGTVSGMDKDVQLAWAVQELLKCQMQSHFHLNQQQAGRVQRIIDRAKALPYAKEMAKYRLDCSATLRWWVHAHAHFPMAEAI